jgi:hypothetical protein
LGLLSSTVGKEETMSDRPHDEKEEEKEEEKKHEKSEKEGKSWEEKWRQDPVSAVVWALILIWAGLVLLAANLGALRTLVPGGVEVLEVWPFIFLGAGALVLLGVVVRLLVPAYRRPIGGDLILGVVFIAIGLGWWVGWEIVGPVAIIGIGLAILLGGLRRRR